MISLRVSSRPSLRFAGCLAMLLASLQLARAQSVPAFSNLIVFGDSLSDVGNIADRAQDEYGVRYPGPDFNYTDGRFTSGKDTNPKARMVFGVWHEQLAETFLKVAPATASLDGGLDYAFGGAKTIDGTTNRSVISEGPFQSTLTIDNMGKQVSDYLASVNNAAPGDALFIVWGGGNDLFDDPSAGNVSQTASNVGGLITRLADAGARTFLVPNVPPLGMVPEYNMTGDPATARNAASASYKDTLNTQLDQTIADLSKQGITITVYRLDIYDLFLSFIAKPASFGYVNVTDSSQGMAVNPNKYLFWDGIHPTTTGHSYLASAAYALLSGEPVISVTAPISEVKGGDPETSFYINRIGGDDTVALSIPYSLSGSAVAGTDYLDLKGMRKLKTGKTSAQVKLQTYANPALKNDAKVNFTLVGGAGYTLGALDATTLLIDPSN